VREARRRFLRVPSALLPANCGREGVIRIPKTLPDATPNVGLKLLYLNGTSSLANLALFFQQGCNLMQVNVGISAISNEY
jgi:hypothetical protein